MDAKHRCCRTAGSFNDWKEPVPLEKPSSSGDWFVSIMTRPGLQQVLECRCHVTTPRGDWQILWCDCSTNIWSMTPGELHLVRLLFQMGRQDHFGSRCWLLAAFTAV